MSNVLPLEMDWEKFIGEYWEKKPVVLSKPLGSPIVSKDILFSAMINASEKWLNTGIGHTHMWFDNKEVLGYKDYLPNKKDGSIENYFNRITGNPQEHFFTYYQEKIESHSNLIWDKAYEFIYGLIEKIGIPTDRIEIDSFIGKYESTPRGIHTDAASTFMHVLSGRKTMLVWPPDFFDNKDIKINIRNKYHKTILDFDYHNVIEEAIILEAGPGDIIYWPSTYWHISISDNPNELSAILNVGLFYGDNRKSVVAEALMQAISKSLDTFSDSITYGNQDNHDIPLLELEGFERFKELITREEFLNNIKELWFKKKSSLGFEKVPKSQVKQQDIDEKVIFYTNKKRPFYWVDSVEKITLFVCGRTFKMNNKNGISRVLEYIKNVESFTIGDLSKLRYEEIGNPLNYKGIKEIVMTLYLFHSLSINPNKSLT